MKQTTKRIYYHGTSADNLESILKHGLSTSEEKLWSCSEDGIYLWDVIELAKANGRDLEEDADYIKEEAFRMGVESGEIACSKAKDCRVVVLQIELDESEVYDDTSCENMQGSGAKVIYRDIKLSEILEIQVSNDLSLLRGYFIGIIMDRDYCNIEFDRIEQKIAEAFKKSEICLDDIDDVIEFETVEIPQMA